MVTWYWQPLSVIWAKKKVGKEFEEFFCLVKARNDFSILHFF